MRDAPAPALRLFSQRRPRRRLTGLKLNRRQRSRKCEGDARAIRIRFNRADRHCEQQGWAPPRGLLAAAAVVVVVVYSGGEGR